MAYCHTVETYQRAVSNYFGEGIDIVLTVLMNSKAFLVQYLGDQKMPPVAHILDTGGLAQMHFQFSSQSVNKWAEQLTGFLAICSQVMCSFNHLNQADNFIDFA
jgi:hypothetical protein